VHPDEPARALSADKLALVWHHSVDLLQRGFVQGSILSTDGQAAKSGRRRYVYNQATCLCSARVKSWQIAQRTAYACLACQPRIGAETCSPTNSVRDAKVFVSKCAPDTIGARLAAPDKMTVAELRTHLFKRGLDSAGTKSILVARLSNCLALDASTLSAVGDDLDSNQALPVFSGTFHLAAPVSAELAAAEKAAAGESRAVEHVADVSNRTDKATSIAKMKVVDIKAALHERSLSTSGVKSVLVKRLVNSIEVKAVEDMGASTHTNAQKREAATALPTETPFTPGGARRSARQRRL
jgi:SAP domain